jgi:hypothetical protein
MYAIQLEPWLDAMPRDQLKIMSISQIKGSKAKVQETMDEVFRHCGLPAHDFEVAVEAKHTRAYDPLDRDTKERLERFYAPHNARLMKLLDDYNIPFSIDSW